LHRAQTEEGDGSRFGLRARLGEAGRRDVAAYTYDAYAAGFAEALLACGAA